MQYFQGSRLLLYRVLTVRERKTKSKWKEKELNRHKNIIRLQYIMILLRQNIFAYSWSCLSNVRIGRWLSAVCHHFSIFVFLQVASFPSFPGIRCLSLAVCLCVLLYIRVNKRVCQQNKNTQAIFEFIFIILSPTKTSSCLFFSCCSLLLSLLPSLPILFFPVFVRFLLASAEFFMSNSLVV